MTRETAATLVLFFLAAAAALSVVLVRPPVALPPSAPASEFSAERAMGYLNLFAQKPHPMGSIEHDRVRDYLMGELIRLGVTPESQFATGIMTKFSSAGSVENIVARLRGSGGGSGAVALVAHYDSVAAGPGAGDDGAGVVTLMETLRALKSGPLPRNDIIFLLTDGEEDGLLGAAAFVAEHPWAKDVRIAINFDSRGTSGVSQMFETSAENGELIRELAAVPHAVSSSVAYEVYKRLPNDTDVTVFKQRGIPVMNFGFIDHWEAYHTSLDTPLQLDHGSLQHNGTYALALARQFGNRDLTKLRAPDEIYFSVPGGGFVHYPGKRALSYTALVFLIFALLCFWALRTPIITPLQLLYGFGASLAAIGLCAAAAFGFERLVNWLHLRWLPEGDVVRSNIYFLSLVGFLVALWTTLYSLLRKKLSAEALALGAFVAPTLLAWVTAGLLSGASYIFLWPWAAGLVSLVAARLACAKDRASPFWIALASLFALPVILIFVPLVNGLFVALGLTDQGALAIGVAIGLGLSVLLPQLELITLPNRKMVPLFAVLAGSALFAAGLATVRYTSDSPKPSIQIYALDADTGKALWANFSSRINPWIAQYVTSAPDNGPIEGFFPRWLKRSFWQHDAPRLPLLPPQVALIENTPEVYTRTLLLRVTSPRRARALFITAPEAEVLEASVNGRTVQKAETSGVNPKGQWSLDYANVPESGIELKLRVKDNGPVKLRVVDRSLGLPEVPGHPFSPRPAAMTAIHFGDLTLVRKMFVF
jgi:hypothetical protein